MNNCLNLDSHQLVSILDRVIVLFLSFVLIVVCMFWTSYSKQSRADLSCLVIFEFSPTDIWEKYLWNCLWALSFPSLLYSGRWYKTLQAMSLFDPSFLVVLTLLSPILYRIGPSSSDSFSIFSSSLLSSWISGNSRVIRWQFNSIWKESNVASIRLLETQNWWAQEISSSGNDSAIKRVLFINPQTNPS